MQLPLISTPSWNLFLLLNCNFHCLNLKKNTWFYSCWLRDNIILGHIYLFWLWKMGPKKEGWIYIWIPVSWRSRLELMVNIHLIDTFTHLQKILWKVVLIWVFNTQAWREHGSLTVVYALVSQLPLCPHCQSQQANLSSFLTCFCCFKTCIVQTSAKKRLKTSL